MKRGAWLGAALLAAVTAALFLLPRTAPSPAPEVSFRTIEGRLIPLSSLRGQPVLVQFWATTCSICLEEQPDLVQLYRRLHPRGLELVAVSMPQDRPDFVIRLAREQDLPFPVALDVDGRVNRAFGGIEATPTTLLIDAPGRVVWRHTGRLPFARLERRIEELLGERS